jgi:hypothetical protein
MTFITDRRRSDLPSIAGMRRWCGTPTRSVWMIFSKKVSEAMLRRNDRLALIKKIGVHDCRGNTSKIIAFFNSMKESGLTDQALTYGRANGVTVFFTLSEDEVVEKILAIPDKKKVETPDKVLVKMVALRIERIFEIVDRFRQRDEMKPMASRTRLSCYGDMNPMLNMIANVKGVRNVDDIKTMGQFLNGMFWTSPEYVKDWKLVVSVDPYPHICGRPWKLNSEEEETMMEAMEVFARPRVTQEIVAQAWRLCSVSMVMGG